MANLGTALGAPTGAAMFEAIANVLIAIANGALTILGGLLTLRVGLVVVIVACLAWLAAIEIEALDRRAYKPPVRPH